MTVEPRVFEVRIRYKRTTIASHWQYHLLPSSSTPVPSPMQTCREARNGGFYKRVSPNIAIQNNALKDLERRYVWLNFDNDMVAIGDTGFKVFESIAHMMKRLRFVRDNSNKFWFRGESSELCTFLNVTEIHVVLSEDGDMRHWHGASQDHCWPCAKENILIIDSKDGPMIKLMELEEKYDRILEAEFREQDPGDKMSFLYGYPVNPY